MVHLPDKRPPASKPWVGLTDEEILRLVPGLYDCLRDPYDCDKSGDGDSIMYREMYLKVRDELAALQQKTDELVVLFLEAHEGAKDSHNYWLHAANKIKTHFN